MAHLLWKSLLEVFVSGLWEYALYTTRHWACFSTWDLHLSATQRNTLSVEPITIKLALICVSVTSKTTCCTWIFGTWICLLLSIFSQWPKKYRWLSSQGGGHVTTEKWIGLITFFQPLLYDGQYKKQFTKSFEQVILNIILLCLRSYSHMSSYNWWDWLNEWNMIFFQLEFL